MGPDDETYVDYLMFDGHPVKFEGFYDHLETELQPVYAATDDRTTLRQQGSKPIEVELKLSKRWRCNSRKRFVKLLMADGISRDGANLLALVARFYKRSYQGAYLRYKLFGLKT